MSNKKENNLADKYFEFQDDIIKFLSYIKNIENIQVFPDFYRLYSKTPQERMVCYRQIATGPGIYLLFREDGKVYVGETLLLRTRTHDHIYQEEPEILVLAYVEKRLSKEKLRALESQRLAEVIQWGFAVSNTVKKETAPKNNVRERVKKAFSDEFFKKHLQSVFLSKAGMDRIRFRKEYFQMGRVDVRELYFFERLLSFIPGAWGRSVRLWRLTAGPRTTSLIVWGREVACVKDGEEAKLFLHPLVLFFAFGETKKAQFPGIRFEHYGMHMFVATGSVDAMCRALDYAWFATAFFEGTKKVVGYGKTKKY